MEVVIEYVLLDNFIIDALILYLTNKILNIPINFGGVVLSAFFGALFALLSPMIMVGGWVMIVLKLVVAFLMVFLATFSFYKLFLRFGVFVGLTFLFAGMLIAVCFFAGVNVLQGTNLIYFSKIPIGALIGLGGVFVVLCVKLAKSLYSTAKHSKFIYKVCLTINNKTEVLQGFLDSGNTLKTKDNLPIIILQENELKHWFNFDERMSLLMGHYGGIKIKNPQKIEVCGIGSKTKILVFDADNLQIENRNYAVAVGVDNRKHFKNFSVLLNNGMGDVLC